MKAEYIVLHHSLTEDGSAVSWGAIRRYHMLDQGMVDIGYHFGIERIGVFPEILMGRMWDERGAHCKQGGMNNRSLGICFVGNYDLIPVPYGLWQRGIDLCLRLMDMFQIPVANVISHHSVAPHKTCPGLLFNIDAFRQQLTDRRDGYAHA